MLPLRCSRLRDSISNDSRTRALRISTPLSSEWVTLISMIFGIKSPPAAALDGACGRPRSAGVGGRETTQCAVVTHAARPRAQGAAPTHRAAAGSAVTADENSG